MSSIQLRNVIKRFGSTEVVHGIDLDIDESAFVVLLGPSGCGKTTTLRMVAGLEDVSEGELSIGGKVVNHVAPKDRGVAMVFQNYALYPHMSVPAEHGIRASPAQARQGGDQPPHRRDRRHPRARRASGEKTVAALRRPASARGHGTRHGAHAGGVPVRRAAFQSGRQASHPSAPGDRQAAQATWHDDPLRHPRPGRSHDACRQDRDHAGRSYRAGGHARNRSSPTRETPSSPPSSAAPP